MTDAIAVTKLTVRYGDQLALDSVSFTVPTRTLAFLVGPNGSGKSSLITALLDLIPYRGTVKILGQSTKAVYHSIGYVPQRFSFDRTIPLTVRELLGLSLDFCHCQVGQHDEQLRRALDNVGVVDLVDRPLSELSGGQLQRVLLARALVHHPKVILLDEPEAGFDRQSEVSLYPLLRQLVTEQGLTVLIASHELDAARRWADQVLVVNGRLVISGPPTKVLTKQTLQEVFR
jgi:zinc transport system ATP-binding protein